MLMEWFLKREFGWFFYPNGDEVPAEEIYKRFPEEYSLEMISDSVKLRDKGQILLNYLILGQQHNLKSH
jgi:hypothetical protein